jgi:hypothetical protein
MPLALTCDCGARFEVEDTLAGQEVGCPECQQALKAPARGHGGAGTPRTSHYALASAALALAGAFTVVGTLAAVGLGITALVRIARHRDRLTGFGFATFGIVAGLLLTGLTLLSLSTAELFGVGGWLRQRTMAERVDTSGPLEIDLGKGWSITRPSEHWGRVRGDRSDDPAVHPLQKDRELLLLHLQRNIYVDVRSDSVDNDSVDWLIRRDFGLAKDRPPWQEPDEEDEPQFGQTKLGPPQCTSLPAVDGWEVTEAQVNVRRGGQPWHFVTRVYRKAVVPPAGNPPAGAAIMAPPGNVPIRLVRGYTPLRRFAANEAELRRALDSFRPRSGP